MKWGMVTVSLVVLMQAGMASQVFDFEDEKGINHVLVILDAPLEFISGKGEGLSGLVSYDPEAPQATEGSLRLQVDSIELNNHLMTKNMYGKRWLNSAEHPEILFLLNSFEPREEEGSLVRGEATGSFSFLGVTKEITVPVSFNYLEDAANKRAGKKKPGDKRDLLVLRSNFTILLDEYGLDLSPPTRLKVSNEVQVKVNVVGYTEQ